MSTLAPASRALPPAARRTALHSPALVTSAPDAPDASAAGLRLHHLYVEADADPTTFMRLLGLIALRGLLPESVRFEQRPDHAELNVWVRMDAEDFRVLCARAETLVGVRHCSAAAS
jgi:acetolactate synthase regulatory subunit